MARTTTDRVIPITIGLPMSCLGELDNVLSTINEGREKPVSRSQYCSYLLAGCFGSKILSVVAKKLSAFSPTTLNELDNAFEPDLFGDVDKMIDTVDSALVEELRPNRRRKKK